MFGMGMPEILCILVIALVVIGPKKLPELAKSLGRAMGEFKQATSEIKDSINVDTPVRKPGKRLTYAPVNEGNPDTHDLSGQAPLHTVSEKEKTDINEGTVLSPDNDHPESQNLEN